MQRRRRPFYIIAHNPNTIDEAKEYLDLGVNALEPDIVFAEGRYYVSHIEHLSYEGVPLLEDYLQALKQLLEERKYNLALIIFDLKTANFDINEFMAVVKSNFSGGRCEDIAILMTHADDHQFVGRYKGDYPNVGIGVDESNTLPSELEEIFRKAGHKNFSYADGITTVLTKPGIFEHIAEAQHCRDHCETESFKLIYTWTLGREASMRKYLDTYIDGIFVDPPDVETLHRLITTAPYNEAYELACHGYNPFTAARLPRYSLVVKTKDQLFAGTDARIVFTLKSKLGYLLKSLPFDGGLTGALERDSTTTIALEGMDLGEIESLTVEAITSDLNAAWLPESVRVESKLLKEPLTFVFNGDDLPEEWIKKVKGPVTKFPAGHSLH
jgi:hypothetical protein